ncbi:low temperature requirement protein A [Peribacillus muralis]|uniref:low temperature requirement protein A n=1 Tax=Peribacillus muralis TaxID=264697 RepID=UPI001F4D423F|nr:low temperature requirement protein A [Peribacillus muralis]MCK1992262.1 low temperature requirement protein A [Peribacillus muralis]MCK2012818.1 low temperature requirement protein A [Peribacillus muralis]
MDEKKVTWLELFYDLLFVAAVAGATHVLLHVEDGYIHPEYLLKFGLIFIPIWWAWVGQTIFINRFGKDLFHQRLFLILQMFFVLIMISSLSVDFDAYYLSFLIGYIGLRVVTAIQYLVMQRMEEGFRKKAALYLGKYFWIGIVISLFSVLFDSWLRYAVLYLGILIDIIVPIVGRKCLGKVPTNTPHLLERFGLFSIILFGEALISTIAVIQPKQGNWDSIAYAILSFTLIISMWWQYFDNLEKKIDKSVQTSGQIIIYGHLFILMSLSMIAAAIRLLFLHEVDYLFNVYFAFGSVLLYFLSTTFVFHQYRRKQHQLQMYHLAIFIGILAVFFIFNLLVFVPNIVIIGELTLFFIVYAKLTTT